MAAGRPTWDALPASVRTHVEHLLGSQVVEHASQPGGYSPGPAERLTCADATRAFLKAVHLRANPLTPDMHRHEAKVLAALPAAMPAPRLLATFERDEWVVLLIEDVDGVQPPLPWRTDLLDHTLRTLTRIADIAAAAPLPDLPGIGERLAVWNGRWRRLLAAPPADLDPWIATRMPELVDRAERVVPRLAGETLCHGDLRADNILVRPNGQIVLIDWPSAVRAVPWFDAALLAIEVATHGGDVDGLLRRVAADYAVDPADLVDALLPPLGYFQYQSRQPPPPGIATVRAFQRAQGDALVSWLQRTELVRWPTDR